MIDKTHTPNIPESWWKSGNEPITALFENDFDEWRCLICGQIFRNPRTKTNMLQGGWRAINRAAGLHIKRKHPEAKYTTLPKPNWA